MTTSFSLGGFPLVKADEARAFLPPEFQDRMDPYFPKEGATCGSEHLQYVLGVAWPLLLSYRDVIVGQRAMTTYTLIGMLAAGDRDPDHLGAGHIFYLGLPGTGKSLLAKVPGRVVQAVATRIQGTVDLLPTDITGNRIIQLNPKTGDRHFEFKQGPIFGNIVMFDEAPRTPARSFSGVLEATSEGTVTVAGETHRGAEPFMILTGNPIESEGQYQLPDAMLDRVMFQVLAEPFTANDYTEILRRTRMFHKVELPTVSDYKKVSEARMFFHETVHVSDEITDFIGALAETINVVDHMGLLADTRKLANYSDDDEIIKKGSMILSGRGAPHLEGAAKALAALRYRNYVTHADILKVFLPVIRHRVRFSSTALALFPEALRPILKEKYAGRSGKTEAIEYLLAKIADATWSHVTKKRG